jgi:hypothetical protein
MRLTSLAAAAAACALTLTACGGDDPDPKKSDKDGSSADTAPSEAPAHEGLPADKGVQLKKMCEALSDAEVSEALGAEVSRGDTVRSNCTYTDLEDLLPNLTVVYQTLAAAGGVETVKENLTVEEDAELEEVADVGDEAYVAVNEGEDGPEARAAVVVKQTYLYLEVTPEADASADDARAAAVALLELVGGRLPAGKGSTSD